MYLNGTTDWNYRNGEQCHINKYGRVSLVYKNGVRSSSIAFKTDAELASAKKRLSSIIDNKQYSFEITLGSLVNRDSYSAFYDSISEKANFKIPS